MDLRTEHVVIDRSLVQLINLILFLVLILIMSVGTILLLVANSIPPDRVWHDLLRDLGIAFWVAAIVTVVFELYTRNRHDLEVRAGVVEAAIRRVVPEAIWKEIRANVLFEDALRRNWMLAMSITEDQNLGANLLRSVSVLSYDFHNLKGRKTIARVLHWFDPDVEAVDSFGNKLPRFVQVSVGKMQYNRGNLLPYLRDNGMTLELPVELPEGTDVRIEVRMEEVIRVPDVFAWWMSYNTEGVSLDVVTAPENFRFVLAAPHHKERVEETTPGRRWVFAGVLLRGQGVELVSSWALESAGDPSHREEAMVPIRVGAGSTTPIRAEPVAAKEPGAP